MAKQGGDTVNDRKCIVTGKSGSADALIRFVASPDGVVVPDLKRNLPGRGCWVTAHRACIEEAVRKNAFSRALKQKVEVSPDLGETVDRLLAKAALGALGLARKAGSAVTGAAQVEKAVRAGKALAVLHSDGAAADGVRKIDQARRATVHLGGPHTPSFTMFEGPELDLAFGTGNVIHAALLDGGPANAALRRLRQLKDYRQGPETHGEESPVGPDDATETEME